MCVAILVVLIVVSVVGFFIMVVGIAGFVVEDCMIVDPWLVNG